MNYLLFVYYDKTVKNSEQKTQEIGTKLAEHMTSGQVKFMYGDKHAIFHFAYKGEFQDVLDVTYFISEEIPGFEYLLTKKGRDYSSNFDEDNLKHLMSLKNTTPKKYSPPTPKPKIDFLVEFQNLGKFFTKDLETKDVCNMTLDELLDKISSQGMESLSTIEKEKLEEYSKSI